VDFLSLQFDEATPVGVELDLDSDHRLSASFRATDAISNELATFLTLELGRFDTDPEGTIQGDFSATFPSAILSGSFAAYVCPPL
jgi:hypothetical protein